MAMLRRLPLALPLSPSRRLVRGVALTVIGGGIVSLLALAIWFRFTQGRRLLVSITSWPGNEYLYLAEQRQLARPFGLDLVIKQTSSLADQRQAFVRGDHNVMATTVPEAIAVCQEAPKRCPELMLVLDESLGADRLIGRSGLSAPAQLVGQRVGLERTVLAEYLLLRSFAGQPIRLEDLQLRFDGPVALVRALQAGDLDAIVTYAPHDTPLRTDPRFRELFSSRRVPGEIVDVIAVAPEFARTRRRDLQALVRTWWAAQAYARQRRREAVEVMAQRQQITSDQFRESERGLRYPDASQQRLLLASDGPVARSIERLAQLMRQAGRLEAGAPLPRPTTAFLEAP
ncbi:MAG: ABC transporter substrate-binding protein [Chitinophagaceae bacterium]|nr:ABC transporter substrate-binding protein [Chitinophagaceae bacterium]